jgi:hypothetical protein
MARFKRYGRGPLPNPPSSISGMNEIWNRVVFSALLPSGSKTSSCPLGEQVPRAMPIVFIAVGVFRSVRYIDDSSLASVPGDNVFLLASNINTLDLNRLPVLR